MRLIGLKGCNGIGYAMLSVPPLEKPWRLRRSPATEETSNFYKPD
jgi:hypothetical protein